MKRLWVLIAIVVFVPALPLVLAGEWIETQLQILLEQPWESWQGFGLILLCLTADLFLPVPSSAVSVFAGAALGIGMGTLACWLGLNAGCAMGYELARWGGRFLPQWLTADLDPQEMAEFQGNAESQQKKGMPWWIALLRPLPLLAEASVLYAGLIRVPRLQFYMLVIAANFVLGLAYSVCGAYAKSEQAMGWALVASLFFPLLGTVFTKRWKTSESS